METFINKERLAASMKLESILGSILALTTVAQVSAATITGKVQDGKFGSVSQPVANAVVMANNGSALDSDTTDAQGNFSLNLTVSGILDGPASNGNFSYQLEQNYPNPFNPSTIIPYTLEKDGRVSIEIFNILGQKVKTVVDGYQELGNHAIEWNGTDDRGNGVSAGVYLLRMQTGNFQSAKKMVLMDGNTHNAGRTFPSTSNISTLSKPTNNITITAQKNNYVFDETIVPDEDANIMITGNRGPSFTGSIRDTTINVGETLKVAMPINNDDITQYTAANITFHGDTAIWNPLTEQSIQRQITANDAFNALSAQSNQFTWTAIAPPSVNGTIYTFDGVLPGTTIKLATITDTLETQSNAQGNYSLNAPAQDYTLIIEHPSFHNYKTPVSIAGTTTKSAIMIPLQYQIPSGEMVDVDATELKDVWPNAYPITFRFSDFPLPTDLQGWTQLEEDSIKNTLDWFENIMDIDMYTVTTDSLQLTDPGFVIRKSTGWSASHNYHISADYLVGSYIRMTSGSHTAFDKRLQELSGALNTNADDVHAYLSNMNDPPLVPTQPKDVAYMKIGMAFANKRIQSDKSTIINLLDVQ
ncbi:T9SS C-terminal target domain-containing protein [Candidatus Woesearchaeota archaeon]|nr:MAG: T9SS C-terminal target domain-containing protein [Candidatus Woesearchaeota archaeon]